MAAGPKKAVNMLIILHILRVCHNSDGFAGITR
jgi:hypothetical protein